MSYSRIENHLPKESKPLSSYKDYSNCLQNWSWGTQDSSDFHHFKMAECLGKPTILALKIFQGKSYIKDFGIKDATGKHEYSKLENGEEQFELFLEGTSSLNDKFELKFHVKTWNEKIAEQKLAIRRFLQNGETQAIC